MNRTLILFLFAPNFARTTRRFLHHAPVTSDLNDRTLMYLPASYSSNKTNISGLRRPH
jgi:hypothetical protein